MIKLITLSKPAIFPACCPNMIFLDIELTLRLAADHAVNILSHYSKLI